MGDILNLNFLDFKGNLNVDSQQSILTHSVLDMGLNS